MYSKMVSTIGEFLVYFWLAQAIAGIAAIRFDWGWLVAGANALALLAACLAYLHWDMSFWKRQGIPGPKPNLFLGSTLTLRNGFHVLDIENYKKYGHTYGSYCFGFHELITSDTKLLRQIFKKDFYCFADRLKTNVVPMKIKKTLMQLILTNLEGDQWRRVRNAVERCLTPAIIDRYGPIYFDCAVQLGNSMARKNDFVPLKEMCGAMTLDVIARMAFGMKLDFYDAKVDCNVMHHTKEIFKKFGYNSSKNFLIVSFANFASMIQSVTGYEFFRNEHHDFFEKFLTEVYRKRKAENNDGEYPDDLLQRLMEHVGDIQGSKKTITEDELIAQLFVFLLVGYDTTSTLLHFILYVLARLPDLQEQLRKEICEVSPPGDPITAYNLRGMELLDRTMKEGMRMYPPAGRATRVCTAPTQVGGIDFVPGMMISVPVYAMHHDPEVYPDPFTFDPDRFLPERQTPKMSDEFSHNGFGFGPRRCVGKILAEIEVKMALACVVRDFHLTPDPESPRLPVEINTRGLTQAKQVLKIRVQKLHR